MIAVLGLPGAGKTAFLGMLVDMLSRQIDRMQMLVRGAFTITFQQATIESLRRCQFPARTSKQPEDWRWLHCQVSSAARKRPLELVLPDVSGEAIDEGLDKADHSPLVRPFLTKCSGAILLVDASQLEADELDEDSFAIKAIDYLLGLNNHPRKGWANRPVAVVLTKADECPDCFEDPEQFMQDMAPSLWQYCGKHLRQHKFFAASVAGACAYRWDYGQRIKVPLRIEPRGVFEPFEWMVERIT
jgi:hypothetical protein